MQIFSSLFYALHCFFVGAAVGGIVSCFDLIRVLIFYILEKNNGTKNQKVLTASILFVVAIICSVFSWEGWLSILPVFATLVFIISLAISRLLVIKFATLLTGLCSFSYLWLSGSKFGAYIELIPVCFALIGIVLTICNHLKNKKKASLD